MADHRDAFRELEDPITELEVLCRALRDMAMMDENGNSRLYYVLGSIANHLEHIHTELITNYEAAAKTQTKSPTLVS